MAQSEPRRGVNRRAVDATLADLRAQGRLSEGHSAVVQLIRSLADAVDRAQGNASLWREYRAGLLDLERATRTDPDGYADLIGSLRAPVGDTEN